MLGKLQHAALAVHPGVVLWEPGVPVDFAVLGGVGRFFNELQPLVGAVLQAAGAAVRVAVAVGDLSENRVILDAATT